MNKKDIVVGDLYKKFEGIGSSCNTYALVTGSTDTIVQYQIISDSNLYANSVHAVRMKKEDFLSYYRKSS